jgi:hypothetical protein
MNTKVDRTERLSQVSILAVLIIGLCFLSYSSKSQDAGTGKESILEKNGIEEIPVTSFEEICEQLDADTLKKLEKPVTLIFSNIRLDQIMPQISKQSGVQFITAVIFRVNAKVS